jgi:hypothetical protein
MAPPFIIPWPWPTPHSQAQRRVVTLLPRTATSQLARPLRPTAAMAAANTQPSATTTLRTPARWPRPWAPSGPCRYSLLFLSRRRRKLRQQRPYGHAREHPRLQHPGLVALLGGLLRASFADGNGTGGVCVGEERKVGAQAKGRQGEEEGSWRHGRARGWSWEGTYRAGAVYFLEGSCWCEELWEGDRVCGMGLAHSREMMSGAYPYRWNNVLPSITSRLLI